MAKNTIKKIAAGSIVKSPLYRRFLMPILFTMLAFACGTYFFAVPNLRQLVYSLEEKAVHTNLNNIQKLIVNNYLAIEAYKKSVMDANKNQLSNITLFMETYLKNKYEQVQNGLITVDDAQWSALEELRAFRYGADDYVWVADYNGYYLSHPDTTMNMEDFSQVRDVFGNYTLMPLIRTAMEEGEAYHSYWWQRLRSDLPAEKLEYAKLFPQWEWVIGTGVFLDDLETQVLLRKEKMIDEIRQALKPITIGKTGYMYVFDAWNNIIIHPDSTLENTDMSGMINPDNGNSLAEDLKLVAHHSTENKVSYKWDKPASKGNFIYDKIDWVAHIDEFDWYVVASVYTDELNQSSNKLRKRILVLAATVVMLSVIIISFLMGKLLNPIRKLSAVAGRVEGGDLQAQSDISSHDEIGYLAQGFNSMVRQLREIILELDSKVLERTRDLDQANIDLASTINKLERHNKEITQFNRMAEKLQACLTLGEMQEVIADSLTNIFRHASGVFYLNQSSEAANKLVPVTQWGDHDFTETEYSLSECRAIKESKVTIEEISVNDRHCIHVQALPPCISICMPLFGQNEPIGLINLLVFAADQKLEQSKHEEKLFDLQRLAITIADQISMALANMLLKEKLQTLSVRDGLTGLFNRRYMEETLTREFQLAERTKRPIGVIILDVDFFKKFNDTYGHEAGDIVLIELAKLLAKNVRKGDVVCRYGGEEFVIILPGPPIGKAMKRAEEIREKVEKELRVEYHEHVLKVTISLGAADFPLHGETPDDILKQADNALYKAKELGRNKAVSA